MEHTIYIRNYFFISGKYCNIGIYLCCCFVKISCTNSGIINISHSFFSADKQ